MTTKNKINKSDIVRQILKDIGADRSDAPEGWKKRVDEELAKHNDEKGNPVKVHQVQIYAIRRNILNNQKPKTEKPKAEKSKTEKPKAKASKKLHSKSIKKVDTNDSTAIALGQWEQFCQFGQIVEKFGGAEKVETMLKLYKQLPQS